MPTPRQTQSLLEAATSPTDAPHLIGKDPRTLSPDDLTQAGLPLLLAKRAIRAKCLDCCGDNASEVRKCVSVSCPLWLFRMTGSLPGAIKKAVICQSRRGAAAQPQATPTRPAQNRSPRDAFFRAADSSALRPQALPEATKNHVAG